MIRTLTAPGRWGIILAGLLGLALLSLLACHGSDTQRPDVPAAADAAQMRATPAPALLEVAELDVKRRAAQIAAAEATAKHDPVTADQESRLAAEIATLESQAQARADIERADMDRRAAADDRRADVQRAEIDARACAAADVARVRSAFVVGALVAGLAAVALVICIHIHAPLWIPGAIASGGVGYVAFIAAAPRIAQGFAVVGLVVEVGLIAAVVIAVALLLRMLVRAIESATDHGDNLRSCVESAMATAGPAATGADIVARVRSAWTTVCRSSSAVQVERGVAAIIAKARARL